MTGLTDEEFCAKLENHFAMYRMNLRSPLVEQITTDRWYRAEVFLVNEIGLFKRADMAPDKEVHLGCDLLVPSSPDSLTPLQLDTTCDLTIRPSTWSDSTDPSCIPPTGVAGFVASGKGAFEYTITPKHPGQQRYGPRYLRIYCKRIENFTQQPLADTLDDWILPLVVGPVLLIKPTTAVETNKDNSHAPIGCWPEGTQMVHSGYRLFGLPTDDLANVAIHESWESGIPGKIWDSALVMWKLLERMARYKPDYLDGKHILDLSAG
jgi:hypothetical protein